MPTIAAKPFILRDMLASIGTDEFAEAINQLTITPRTSPVMFQGGRPSARFLDLPDPEWDVAMQFAQDWTAATSLSRYLMTNAGKVVEFVFKPMPGAVSATSPSVKVNVLIIPGAIGGTIGQHAVSNVTLPAKDQPAITTS